VQRADLANLVNLDEFGEGAVIHQLRSRYSRGEIYTCIGSILVSINPYAQLPIYGAGRVEQYRAAAEAGPQALAALDPHVFAVAAEAYARLYDEDLVGAAADPSVKRSQAIICSGESGAGKTEVCKSVLQYLSDVAGSVSGVEQQILKSNPILESFGNSRTLRNNNSSRFGKVSPSDPSAST
jgi:myosin heavy subunit